MDIIKAICGDVTVFTISGRIDTITAEDFQDKIESDIDLGVKKMALDFDDVEYVSSAGLRAILYLKKKLDTIPESSFKLKGVNESVMEVFEMTGFSDFLEIETKKKGAV